MKKLYISFYALLFLALVIVIPGCGTDDGDTGKINAPDNNGVDESASQDDTLPTVNSVVMESLGGGKQRVIVVFSEAIAQSTATANSGVGIYELTSHNTLAATPVAATLNWLSPVTLNVDTTVAIDTANVNNDYVLKITRDVKDMSGGSLDGNASATLVSLDDNIESGSDYFNRLTSTSVPLLDYDLDRPTITSIPACLQGGTIDTVNSENTVPCITVLGDGNNYFRIVFSVFMDKTTINATNIVFEPAIAGSWYAVDDDGSGDDGDSTAPTNLPVLLGDASIAGEYETIFYFRSSDNATDGQMHSLTLYNSAIKGAAIDDDLNGVHQISYASTDGVDDGTDNNAVNIFYVSTDPTATAGPIVNEIVQENTFSGNRYIIYFSTSNQTDNLMDTSTLIADNVVFRDGGGSILNFSSSTDTETLGGINTTRWVLDLADSNAAANSIVIQDAIKDSAGNKLNGDGDTTMDEFDNYTGPLAPNASVILGASSVSPTTVTAGSDIGIDVTLVDYDAAGPASTFSIDIVDGDDNVVDAISSAAYSPDTTQDIAIVHTVNAALAAGIYAVRYQLDSTTVRVTALTVQ